MLALDCGSSYCYHCDCLLLLLCIIDKFTVDCGQTAVVKQILGGYQGLHCTVVPWIEVQATTSVVMLLFLHHYSIFDKLVANGCMKLC